MYQDLATALQRVSEEPGEPQGLRIEMSVSGGLPSERYEFHFSATDEGELESALRSELHQQDYKPRASRVESPQTAALFRMVDLHSMLDFGSRRVAFPPDSLVGYLSVTRGEETIGFYFMADPGQAQTAGFVLPSQLQELVDAVYDISGRQLNFKDVRP